MHASAEVVNVAPEIMMAPMTKMLRITESLLSFPIGTKSIPFEVPAVRRGISHAAVMPL